MSQQIVITFEKDEFSAVELSEIDKLSKEQLLSLEQAAARAIHKELDEQLRLLNVTELTEGKEEGEEIGEIIKFEEGFKRSTNDYT